MRTLMLVAVVVAAAGCQADNRNIERKLDEMAKDIKELKAQGGRGGAGAAAPRPQRVEPDRQKTYSMPIEGDPVDGPADAKVTLVKAYDYACPYCEKVRDTMDELRKKYGNDLRIVFKQFVVHPQVATASALAATKDRTRFICLPLLSRSQIGLVVRAWEPRSAPRQPNRRSHLRPPPEGRPPPWGAAVGSCAGWRRPRR